MKNYTKIISKLGAKYLAANKIHLNLKKPVITFTFDDIPFSAVSTGVAILDNFGIKGTLYIAADLLGKKDDSFQYATRSQIQALAENGHEIASHTYSHIRINTISVKELIREIHANNNFLMELTGKNKINHFSYPFGEVSFSAKLYLTKQFLTARSSRPGINTGIVDLSFLKAIPLYQPQVNKDIIQQHIAEAIDRRGWLIFYTHDVKTHPTKWGISSQLFEFSVQTAHRSNALILNMEQAYGSIRQTDTEPAQNRLIS